jgi:4-amino-4-deoxychorismate mutase
MALDADSAERRLFEGDLLEVLRARLDQLDAELVGVLSERVAVCRRIAQHKCVVGVPMMQPHRIDVVHRRTAQHAVRGGLDPAFVKRLYELIIEETCRIEDLVIDAAATSASERGRAQSDESGVPCARS